MLVKEAYGGTYIIKDRKKFVSCVERYFGWTYRNAPGPENPVYRLNDLAYNILFVKSEYKVEEMKCRLFLEEAIMIKDCGTVVLDIEKALRIGALERILGRYKIVNRENFEWLSGLLGYLHSEDRKTFRKHPDCNVIHADREGIRIGGERIRVFSHAAFAKKGVVEKL